MSFSLEEIRGLFSNIKEITAITISESSSVLVVHLPKDQCSGEVAKNVGNVFDMIGIRANVLIDDIGCRFSVIEKHKGVPHVVE